MKETREGKVEIKQKNIIIVFLFFIKTFPLALSFCLLFSIDFS